MGADHISEIKKGGKRPSFEQNPFQNQYVLPLFTIDFCGEIMKKGTKIRIT